MTTRKSDGTKGSNTRRPPQTPSTSTNTAPAKKRVVRRVVRSKPAEEHPAPVEPVATDLPTPEPEPAEPDYASMSIDQLEALMMPKQLLFCIEFLKHFNATRAARDARYSEKSAGAIGAENLTKPVIQAYLAKAKEQVFGKAKLEVSDLVKQMMRLGFSDVRRLFDENGQLKDVTQLGDDIAAAIQSIEIERRTEGKGEDKEVYYVHKIRLADKKGNLEMLGRYMQMFIKEEDDEAAAAQRKADARTTDLLAELITDAKGKVKKAGKS